MKVIVAVVVYGTTETRGTQVPFSGTNVLISLLLFACEIVLPAAAGHTYGGFRTAELLDTPVDNPPPTPTQSPPLIETG